MNMDYKQPLPSQKILAVGGSPRKRGNSDTLLDAILEGVNQEGISNDKVQLRDYDFKSCIGCERCRKDGECTGVKDQMQEIYPKVIDSQAMVWISPAHNYNVTAIMKAFIDRLYTFYNFDDNRPRGWNSQLSGQKRKAVIVGVAEQVNEEDMGFTIEGMRLTLNALGYEVVDELAVYGIFDRGGIKNNPDIIDKAKQLGVKLAKSIQ